MHDAEAWNAALCRGEKGPRWARIGEKLRRAADLEHWAAFPGSFADLAGLIAEAGSGSDAPATVCVLSGDVHHAYIAEPSWPAGRGPDARVLQLTCSPVHNRIPLPLHLAFLLAWTGAARFAGRRLAGHGGIPKPPVDWRKTGGPWFGNQLMTLTMRGRSAALRLEQARARRGDGGRVDHGGGVGADRPMRPVCRTTVICGTRVPIRGTRVGSDAPRRHDEPDRPLPRTRHVR
ncbi:hypothetical protein SGLAM104S_10108 [Streptomyces glaucescens]